MSVVAWRNWKEPPRTSVVIEPSPRFEQNTSKVQGSPISRCRSLFVDQLRIWQEEGVTCCLAGGGRDLLFSEVYSFPSTCWECLTKTTQIPTGLRTGWNRVGKQDRNLLRKVRVLPLCSLDQFCCRLANLTSGFENFSTDSQKVPMHQPERFWGQE